MMLHDVNRMETLLDITCLIFPNQDTLPFVFENVFQACFDYCTQYGVVSENANLRDSRSYKIGLLV